MKFKLVGCLLLMGLGALGQTPAPEMKKGFAGLVISTTNGTPLPASVITIVASGKKIITDHLGKFSLSDMKDGKYLIRISSMGYNEILKEITLPGEMTINLDEMESELDRVIVTAVAGATKIKRTPVSIYLVSKKELTQSNGTNLIDVLVKAAPGISAITTGPNISKPFIRGLGYNRVLTLYDGIRQEGQQWGDEHGIEIDPYGISRAEIVKGPASLLYGSDAIAGVVNLLPGYPDGKEGKLSGDATSEFQSNNGLIGSSASLHYRKNGWLWGARGSARMATDYQNSVDGRVYNTGFSEKHLSLMTGWETPRMKNYLHTTYYDNLQEIPDGSRDSLTRAFTYQTEEADKDDIRNRLLVPDGLRNKYAISPLHQYIQHFRIYHKGFYNLGGGNLSTILGFQQNSRKEYNHPTQPNQAGLNVLLNTLNYEVKYGFPEWKILQLTVGVNGMLQVNRNKDATDFPIPDYRLFDIGSFLMAKKEFTRWSISGGIRLDHRNVNWNDFYIRKDRPDSFTRQVHFPDTALASLAFPSFAQKLSGLSGSIGFVYNFSNRLTLKANVARGYRSPSIPETGSDGLDPGARIYYIGNRNFKPEFSFQTDMGLFGNYPNFDFSFELFNNQISNYIFFQKQFKPDGQPLEIVPGNATYAYKQGSARLYGTEASLAYHPKSIPWFSLQYNLSAITGINTDKQSLKIEGEDAKYLPLIPPFKSVGRIRIDLPQKSLQLTDVFFQTEIESNAAQTRFYAVDDTETRTEGYLLVNFSAGLSLKNKKEQTIIRLQLQANNLFDITYQSHQNRLKYFEYYSYSTSGYQGIYNMGRNLAAKIIFSW